MCTLMTFAMTLASQDYQVSGYVSDSLSRERIAGATIYLPQWGKGTYTNEYGYFQISAPAGDVVVEVAFLGYAPKRIEIQVDGPVRLPNIALPPAAQTLGEVTVTEASRRSYEIGRLIVSGGELGKAVQLGGEVDVLKALQLLPGVKYGVEGTSGLFVRGGGADQSMYLLDDVPLYNTSHLFGLVSTFSGDNIRSTSLYKGAFPARYGGRLAAVVDVAVKDGNAARWEKEATLGLISSRLSLNGPLLKDRWTVSLAARRSLYEVVRELKKGGLGGPPPRYSFYDLHFKTRFSVTRRHDITLFGYQSGDGWANASSLPDGSSDQEDRLRWGNRLGYLKWDYKSGVNFFINLMLYSNGYDFGIDNRAAERQAGVSTDRRFAYASGVQDRGAKLRADYLHNDRHYLRGGAEWVRHRFTPGISELRVAVSGQAAVDTSSGSNQIRADELRLYIEDDVSIGRLRLNAGLHLSALMAPGRSYANAEPRLSAAYRIGERTTVQASYSRMAQYLHLLSNSGLGLPTDLWLPVTDGIPPALSHNMALGAERQLGGQYSLSVEAYYRTMEGMVSYREGAGFLLFGENWPQKVLTGGTGRAYGLEFLLRKTTGKLSGWVAYTLSRATRRFDGLNRGRSFPFKYDRPHDLAIVLQYRPNAKHEFSANWLYATGNAATLPIGFYPSIFHDGTTGGGAGISTDLFELPSPSSFDTDRNAIPIYGGVNQGRFPDYHRLDVAYNRTFRRRRSEHVLNLSVYNLYNRKNTLYISHGYENTPIEINRPDTRSNRQGSLRSFSQFPVLPSIAYTIRF